jgi:Lon protease-like protein
MASEMLLPLFPLEVVLLPQAALPLHIFEDRYKLMIGEAIEQRSEFGIVLSKDNSLVNVGCTTTVEKVTKQYPDGRLDILTRGRRRFEVLFLDEQKPYLRGAVHFFDDEDLKPPAPEAIARLRGLFNQALALMPSLVSEPPAPEETVSGFQVAGLLPLELELKQRVLTMRSERERVGVLSDFLAKMLPRLERARHVERVSRGNGQGR